MQVFSTVITFTTAPVGLSLVDGGNNPITRGCKIFVEPASGTHVMYVEVKGTATGAGDATAGVIKRLNAYNASGILDNWDLEDQSNGNTIDLLEYVFDGTSGEKCRVTVHVN